MQHDMQQLLQSKTGAIIVVPHAPGALRNVDSHRAMLSIQRCVSPHPAECQISSHCCGKQGVPTRGRSSEGTDAYGESIATLSVILGCSGNKFTVRTRSNVQDLNTGEANWLLLGLLYRLSSRVTLLKHDQRSHPSICSLHIL